MSLRRLSWVVRVYRSGNWVVYNTILRSKLLLLTVDLNPSHRPWQNICNISLLSYSWWSTWCQRLTNQTATWMPAGVTFDSVLQQTKMSSEAFEDVIFYQLIKFPTGTVFLWDNFLERPLFKNYLCSLNVYLITTHCYLLYRFLCFPLRNKIIR